MESNPNEVSQISLSKTATQAANHHVVCQMINSPEINRWMEVN
jgi:hypothetical protein